MQGEQSQLVEAHHHPGHHRHEVHQQLEEDGGGDQQVGHHPRPLPPAPCGGRPARPRVRPRPRPLLAQLPLAALSWSCADVSACWMAAWDTCPPVAAAPIRCVIAPPRSVSIVLSDETGGSGVDCVLYRLISVFCPGVWNSDDDWAASTGG